jgi:hypothetical protein
MKPVTIKITLQFDLDEASLEQEGLSHYDPRGLSVLVN